MRKFDFVESTLSDLLKKLKPKHNKTDIENFFVYIYLFCCLLTLCFEFGKK